MVNKRHPIQSVFLKYGYAAFFLYIAIFLCFFYNYHLLYTEQLQIFQFTNFYFLTLIERPGGLANYIGSFITQFYIFNHAAGLIISSLLFLLFFLQKKIEIAWHIKNGTAFSLILPALFTLFFMDINAQAGGLLATIIAMLFVWLTALLPDKWYKYLITLFFMPILYAITGGGLITYTLLLLAGHLLQEKKNIPYISVLLLFSLVLPLVVRQYFIPLPWNHTWIGTAFYKGNTIPDLLWWLLFTPAILLLLTKSTGKLLSGIKYPEKTGSFLFIGIFIGTIVALQYNKNQREETIYRLDHLLKKQDWQQIVQIAEKQPFHNQVFVSYVNIALLNQGLLPDKMMNFSQRPEVNEFWTSSYLPMFLTGESYYHLDMYNAARAYLFMANTQSPLSASPFIYLRLAELETVRGNAKAGMKYVQALKQTLFYREQAEKMEQAIQGSNYRQEIQSKIDRYTENDSFLAKEMLYNVTCKHKEDPYNRKVLDFLLAKYILANDYKNFLHCIAGLPYSIGNDIPRLYQEFLLMYAYMLDDNTLIKKWGIQQAVVTDFYKYLQINQSGQSEQKIKEELKKTFGHSYWFYMQHKNDF